MLDFITSLGLSPAFIEFFSVSLLNGVSYGLLLFMLSSGLTLIFSMMGVLNFAHASFYMLGAYVAYSVEKTGYTFAPVKYIEAYVASTPTSCQMKRPG